MSSNINAVLAWTVCTLVASFACRCGTLHGPPDVSADPAVQPPEPYNPFDPAQSPIAIRRARIDAIKTDILGKLGLEDVEEGSLPAPAANMTSAERRRAMQQYRQSVDQMRGKSHRIPGEDKQLGRAKQFLSFTATQPGIALGLMILSKKTSMALSLVPATQVALIKSSGLSQKFWVSESCRSECVAVHTYITCNISETGQDRTKVT